METLRDQFRAWFVQAVGWYGLASQQGCVAALDHAKAIAAELSLADLSAFDSRPVPASHLASAEPWKPTDADWDDAVKRYAANGYWGARWFGPDPSLKTCRCPKEILQRHGIDCE